MDDRSAMRRNTKKKMYVLLAICTTSIPLACTGTHWTKEGENQKMMERDQSSCEAIAEIKGRADFPKILMPSSKAIGPGRPVQNANFRDINLKNFTQAKIRYKNECMLDMGYRIE